MRIDKKGWNIRITFERTDWTKEEKNAREVISRMKEIGARYYAGEKMWILKNTPEARELLDWVQSGPEHDNRVDLDEYDEKEFTRQFEELP